MYHTCPKCGQRYHCIGCSERADRVVCGECRDRECECGSTKFHKVPGELSGLEVIGIICDQCGLTVAQVRNGVVLQGR